MKKKLLTLAAVFGMCLSSWAMAPHADNAGHQPPQAQFGQMVFTGLGERYGWQTGSYWYGVAESFTVGLFGGVGVWAGSGLGPVGMVVGGGLGAA